jgi:prepilin-type N-terminal cleavage/methylation domain-containing protein
MRKLVRAFTLIELLTVIAIIGVLSSIVLSSLTASRSKAIDAAIKANLKTVASQAVLDYDGFPNAYSGAIIVVDATPAAWTNVGSSVPGTPQTSVLTIIAASLRQDRTAGYALAQVSNLNGGRLQWGITPLNFVIQAALSTSDYWCIDSLGTAKVEFSLLNAGDILCP